MQIGSLRDLRVQVNGKLKMPAVCPDSQKGQPCPWVHQAPPASQGRWLSHCTPHCDSTLSPPEKFWASHFRKIIKLLECLEESGQDAEMSWGHDLRGVAKATQFDQLGEKRVRDDSASSMTSSRGTALEHKWMEWICIRENSDWTLGKDSSLVVRQLLNSPKLIRVQGAPGWCS